MNNETVIKKFLNKEKGKTALRDILNGCFVYKGRTLESTGRDLINYSTIIAYWNDNGDLYINSKKYSVTTSKIQTALRYWASTYNIQYIEYKEIEV